MTARILVCVPQLNHCLFHRGCLFITYEVVALDKSVTIDTSAILQEKYKSYIYLRATPSDEKENLTAGTECHIQGFELVCETKTKPETFAILLGTKHK